MKRKNKSVKGRRTQSTKNPLNRRKRQKRQLLQMAIALLIVAPLIGGALAAFKHNYDVTHDLSVIGKGVPTVVQIHDPGCQLCQQLRRNASAAAGGMENRLLLRIADVTTPEGRRLQRQHQVPHVTLLLFDGDGKLRRVLNGVKGEELLKHTFTQHVERWG